MKLSETSLDGVYLIEIDPHYDDRGFFASIWNAKILDALHLEHHISQCNLSYTRNKGTVRGFHYQVSPDHDVKVVRCIRGAVYDTILDLRPESPTYLQHFQYVLRQDKYQSLYIPTGCAHGFQSLTNHCEVMFYTNQTHLPEATRGIRWNDPTFNVKWPIPISSIPKHDQSYPDWHAN